MANDITSLNDQDEALAWRFAESCYGTATAAPTRAGMMRLAEIGLVIEIAPGQFAETPALRAHGF